MSVISPGLTDVLMALAERADNPPYGTELARDLKANQPSVLRWLKQLDRAGFAEVDFVIQGRTGGTAAEYWTLTPAGRKLVEALVEARELVSA